MLNNRKLKDARLIKLLLKKRKESYFFKRFIFLFKYLFERNLID
jgi:hypothetical protein